MGWTSSARVLHKVLWSGSALGNFGFSVCTFLCRWQLVTRGTTFVLFTYCVPLVLATILEVRYRQAFLAGQQSSWIWRVRSPVLQALAVAAKGLDAVSAVLAHLAKDPCANKAADYSPAREGLTENSGPPHACVAASSTFIRQEPPIAHIAAELPSEVDWHKEVLLQLGRLQAELGCCKAERDMQARQNAETLAKVSCTS